MSRLTPEFTPRDGGAAAPLNDPYLSRTPLRIRGDAGSKLELSCELDDVVVDGEPLRGQRELSPAALEHGVVIELADRVVLLLHLSSGDGGDELPGLLGASDGIARVRRQAQQVAASDAAVLLRGESGSGKEEVARAIHAHSTRRNAPLLAINMAALPTSTAASALFGHQRGAFTGAVDHHVGLFERADGGTLFLDEVGETPDEVQPMLLRVLETGELTPLGATRERRVDVRIIAATDVDLGREVDRGAFRRALFHRLAGFELRLPPLRERREDIAPLLLHFLREELAGSGHAGWLESGASDATPKLPAAIVARMLRHPLDGNVRQLRNWAQRIVIASGGAEQLELDSELELLIAPASEPGSQPNEAHRDDNGAAAISNEELLATLERNRWAPGRTAAELRIPTSTLYDLMRRCPAIRKAKDIDDSELQRALQASANDVCAAAAELRVSERALRMVLRERGVTPT